MKPYVHYHAQKSPPLDSTASQLNQVHTLTLYFFEIHFNSVKDLINAFPGNSSVNSPIHSVNNTAEVFSM
jgi:hypothetical protein